MHGQNSIDKNNVLLILFPTSKNIAYQEHCNRRYLQMNNKKIFMPAGILIWAVTLPICWRNIS